MPVTWTDAKLNELRFIGDPEADDVVETYFKNTDHHPATLFRSLVRPEPAGHPKHPVLEEYYATTAPLPDWHDPDAMRRGVEFFTTWGLEIGLGLFCCALPIGYAAAPTARILDITARLETDARRRVFETAQMVLDVTAPDALVPGATGYQTVRHVRLMHAGVRYLVSHDPRIAQVTTPPEDGTPHWCEEWGRPISQEHKLGALLAFGYEMVAVLDLLGVDYDEADADAYLHLWSVVGFLLGVRGDLLPLDRASAAALDPLVRRRDLAATAAGPRLTAALLKLLDECGPGHLMRGLPAAGMRHMLGDEVANLLEVPRARFASLVLGGMRPLFEMLNLGPAHNRALAAIARRFTRAVMVEFIHIERGPHRPAFAVPDHLRAAWALPGSR